jgi:hypothetical protein
MVTKETYLEMVELALKAVIHRYKFIFKLSIFAYKEFY